MIDQIPLMNDNGEELYFDENDIRQACSKLVCGDHSDECIGLMKAGSMECALCYAVLKAQKKPFSARKITGDPKKEE